MDLKSRILDIGFDLGFSQVVVASPEPLAEGAKVYQQWLDNGYAAEMAYLKRDPARRTTPLMTFNPVRSIIVASVSYYQEIPPAPEHYVWGRVAAYAVGLDYHQIIRQKLELYADLIEREIGRPLARRSVTDDAALFEQALAARHGLGFTGKNSLIIGPKLSGSFNLISELFIDLELPADQPYKGTCGACFRCGSACPTEAISHSDVPGTTDGAYMVDANLCISYLTIENKGGISVPLRSKLGDWVFGCDICQDVCPYNQKPPPCPWPELSWQRGVGHYLDLLGLFEIADDAQWRKQFAGSPVLRPKLRGIRRNAMVVLGNKLQAKSADPDLIVPALSKFVSNEVDEMLLEHGAWALAQSGTMGRGALHNLLQRDLSEQTKAAIALYC